MALLEKPHCGNSGVPFMNRTTSLPLTISEMPTHTHAAIANVGNSATADPTGGFFAAPSSALGSVYGPATNLVAMNPGMTGNTGGSQAHLNMQPFLTLSFCIALQGIFPSPN